MPRPGPRPYECVRRAWHSDRHQPMRGSIIQQIFRVVYETHCPATKKNREWQEKLPIVALKAEEIMYSKANSEAEYMDLETLWGRVNDAIDTIIKRDESTETGELLPPCVEAALNLGCIPVRASRSQRHANPRSYLSPRAQEPGLTPTKILNNSIEKQSPQLSPLPLHSGNQLTSPRPVAVNPISLGPEPNKHVMYNNNPNNPITSCNYMEVAPSGHIPFIRVETKTLQNRASVYPLYYGRHFRPELPRLGIQVPRNQNGMLVGTPILPSTAGRAKMGCLQDLLSCERDESASDRACQPSFRNNHGKAHEMGFDLSLRLGFSTDTCTSPAKGSAYDTDNVELSSSSQGGNKSGYRLAYQEKEFSFFPEEELADDPFRFHASQWNFEGGGQNVEAPVRKRKASFNSNLEDGLISAQPRLESNEFTSRMKMPGL